MHSTLLEIVDAIRSQCQLGILGREAAGEQLRAVLALAMAYSREATADDRVAVVSELLWVRDELALPTSAQEWTQIHRWLSDSWSRLPDFVESALWFIAQQDWRDLFHRIEEALTDPDERVASEASSVVAYLRETGRSTRSA